MISIDTFPNAPGSVTKARYLVTDALRSFPQEVRDSVETLLSELATNCVRHTSSEFTVRIDTAADKIRVDVTDSGPGTPRIESPPLSEPAGRGLRIVDLLADRWGIISDDPSFDKTVWFEIANRPGTRSD